MRLTKRILAVLMSVLMIVTSANIVVLAADEPTITVSSTTGKAGETVDVTISVSGNPGVVGMKFKLDYPSDKLTLTEVTDPELFSGANQEYYYPDEGEAFPDPYTLEWSKDTARTNYTDNGVLVTLHFTVNEDTAVGEYPITITVPKNGIVNKDMQAVDFALVNGKVTVEETIVEPDPEPPIDEPDVPVDGDVVIEVSEVTILAGTEAVVEFNVVKNDTGFAGLAFTLEYDEALGEPTFTWGDFDKPQVNKKNAKYAFINMDDENFEGTGNLMTLTFPVDVEFAEGKYSVGATILEASDASLEDVVAVIDNGYVEVVHGVPGDINMDGGVTIKDVLLLIKYYLEVEGIEVDGYAVDTNGDGAISIKDVLLLIKYYLEVEGIEVYYAGKAYGRATSLLQVGSMYNAPVAASDVSADVAIEVSEVAIPAGTEAVVEFKVVKNDTGFAGLAFTLEYDEALGEPTFTWGDFDKPQVNKKNAKYAFINMDDENFEGTGTLMTLTFPANAELAEGKYSVGATILEASDASLEDVVAVIDNGYVEVLGCQHTGDKTHVPAKDATCVAPGNVEYWICGDCGKYIDADNAVIADVTIPKNDANHVVKAEDAALMHDTDAGKHYYVCGCGNVYTGEYTTKLVNAVTETCGAEGYSGDTYCTTCEGEAGLIAKGTVISATGAHTGGEADCMNPAKCAVCGTPYGEKALDKHVGGTEMKSDATHHWGECACGTKFENEEHYGGTATCVAQAVCEGCGTSYGAKNPDYHADGDTIDADETHHWVICACGQPIKEEEHYGGEATCVAKAICDKCGTSYGEKAPDKHVGSTEMKSDATHHWDECACGQPIKEEKHYGGEATCVAKAICEKCGTSYGEKAPDKHVGSTEMKSDETYHWGECACGVALDEEKHYGGEATCEDKAECEVCGTPYGELDPENHVGGTVMKYDDDYHWFVCSCGADLDSDAEKEAHEANDEWSHDADSHWHECECGKVMDEKAAHTIRKDWVEDAEAGIRYKDCTECGRILASEEFEDDTISAIEAAMIALRNQKFIITASAGEGGSISNEGRNFVKFDRSITFEITPDEGYAIESVLVNGKDVGAVEEYTFNRVRKNQTIVASFVEIEDESSDVIDEAIDEESWVNPFVDVADDADYIDAIEFVYENGLFKGISDNEFAPEMTMTRGMFVTVLGRAAGVDIAYYTDTSFDDVVLGEWYAPYVEWAAENEIVLGYGDGKFGVNDQITVEQAAVILARYAEYTGIYEAAEISLELFADADSVSDWALEAMMWAVENGIYTGESGVLAPQALAPRALIAEMLYNSAMVFAD